MSGKLLATVGHVVTLDLVDALAERAEIDRASARKAAELGVPAILVALTESALRAGGSARLTRALQNGSVAWGQEGASAFLLGDQRAGALASAIGRFVGARASSTSMFLNDLTISLLSALRQASGDLNADGKTIADLLKARSEETAAAMPVGLATLLGTNGSSERPPTVLPPSSRRRDSSVGRSRGVGRAGWVLALLALTGLTWYLLAAGVKQQTDGEPGDRVVSAVPVPDSMRAKLGTATDQLHGSDVFGSAREEMRRAANLLGVTERRIATALVSLGRLLGLSESSLANLAVDVPPSPDQGRAEERRLLGGAAAPRTGSSAAAFAHPNLSFASQGFREAILNSRRIANQHPAGAGAVTQ